MKVYGLVGKSLKHSFSKDYFSSKFKREGITNTEYKNFELSAIEEITKLIDKNPNLLGFNITIPYKEDILPFIDELSPEAQEIKSINTVVIKDNKLIGHNTDCVGFKQSLKPFLELQHTHALIFGSGGSSKAVEYTLKMLDIKYFIVSRNPSQDNHISYKDIDTGAIERYKLLINTTPLGMQPKEESFPDIPYEGIGNQHLVYDLIYNPSETLFLKKATKMGAACMNGMDMLKLQAEASWHIWNKNQV